MARFSLIITAAGSGTRFGGTIPKVLIPILGKPVIAHTLSAFHPLSQFEEVIITTGPGLEKAIRSVVGPIKKIQYVVGKDTRRGSVEAAFNQLKPVDFVMIHDAARPAVSRELVQKICAAIADKDAVIPVTPVVDTIKWIESGWVKETLPREKLVQVQTPQAFRYDILGNAYRQFPELASTDEAGLVELAGTSVYTVEGDLENIKLTTPKDLTILTTTLETRFSSP